jgi:hypothetical protein
VTAGVLALAGCASLLGIDSDRYVASDEGGTPLEADVGDAGNAGDAGDAAPHEAEPTWPAGWSCLNDPVPTAPSGNLELALTFTDVSNASTSGSEGTPVPGADVHACNKLDLSCASPFGDVTTDDAGVADLMVPGGFDGYFEMRAQGYTNAILQRTPILASESENQGVAEISLLAEAAPLANLTQNPSLSIALVTAEDCNANVAAGITFEVGSPGLNETVVYLLNNLPSQSATETDSVSGTALIFNVPSGALTVSASFAATKIPIRTVTTIARAADPDAGVPTPWVTYLQIRPDQATVHL